MVSSLLEKPSIAKHQPLLSVPNDGLIINNGHADSLVEKLGCSLEMVELNAGEKFIDIQTLKKTIGYAEPKNLGTHQEFVVFYKRVKDTRGLVRCLEAEFRTLITCLDPRIFSALAGSSHEVILRIIHLATERLVRLTAIWCELYPQLTQMIWMKYEIEISIIRETELHQKGALKNLREEIQSLENCTLEINSFVIDALISLAKNKFVGFQIYQTITMQILDAVFAST